MSVGIPLTKYTYLENVEKAARWLCAWETKRRNMYQDLCETHMIMFIENNQVYIKVARRKNLAEKRLREILK